MYYVLDKRKKEKLNYPTDSTVRAVLKFHIKL
jgi:hypothetical protein